MGPSQHPHLGPSRLRLAIITVSDTRTAETDASGSLARRMAEEAGHRVVGTHIVRDEPAAVRALLQVTLEDREIDAILLTGGTGISPRDGTFEVVTGLLEKTLPGFGELFRALSYQEMGSAAMLSRAVGGLARGKVVFSVPGSPAAVELALSKLILPELSHAAGEARKR